VSGPIGWGVGVAAEVHLVSVRAASVRVRDARTMDESERPRELSPNAREEESDPSASCSGCDFLRGNASGDRKPPSSCLGQRPLQGFGASEKRVELAPSHMPRKPMDLSGGNTITFLPGCVGIGGGKKRRDVNATLMSLVGPNCEVTAMAANSATGPSTGIASITKPLRR
jgi:hypothetical protein